MFFHKNKNNINQKVKAIFDEWYVEKEKSIDALLSKLDNALQKLSSLEKTIYSIQSINIKVPLEGQLLLAAISLESLNDAYHRAEMMFVPYTRQHGLTHGLATIHGEVDLEFSTVIELGTVEVVLLGLKTNYSGDDVGKFQMWIRDRVQPPFLVDKETKEIVFVGPPFVLDEQDLFRIKKIEGVGILKFSVIGYSIIRGL